MYEDLVNLIYFSLKKYNLLLEEWKGYKDYKQINLRKVLVKDVKNDIDILNIIINYRTFINSKFSNLFSDFTNLNWSGDNKLDLRVKARNSIEYKIERYINYHDNGEIPLNKCINDLFGIRIIFNEDIDYKIIKEIVNKEFGNNIKCIDSSKGVGYVATHIYLKYDNYSFPWEIQVWDKKHEKSNIICHNIYKQDYIKWENENKGGELL